MNNEIWKFIPDTENLYQISNYGRVRRMHKQVFRKRFTILTGGFTKCGYKHHSISVNTKTKTINPHIIVAKMFVKGYKQGLYVNHIDCDKSNNYYKNLEWVTAKKNAEHASKNKLYIFSENHHNSKLSDKEVIAIRKNSKIMSQRKLAKTYSVSQRTIWNILHNKIYNHI